MTSDPKTGLKRAIRPHPAFLVHFFFNFINRTILIDFMTLSFGKNYLKLLVIHYFTLILTSPGLADNQKIRALLHDEP